MYLVPKKIFDDFINKSSTQTSGLVKQINNLDVNDGGRVIIHNDGEIKEQKREKSPDREKSLSEDEHSPTDVLINSSDEYSQNLINPETNQQQDIQIVPSNQLVSSNLTPTVDKDKDDTTIYVIDKDGLKTSKRVSSSKISNLDWISDEKRAKKSPDIFITKEDMRNKKGSRKSFNKKYTAAPSFLKRNLPLFTKYDKNKIDNHNIPDNKTLEFKQDTLFDNNESRVKVNVLSDDDVPMIENIRSVDSSKRTNKRKMSEKNDDNNAKKANLTIRGRKRKSSTEIRRPKRMKNIDWTEI